MRTFLLSAALLLLAACGVAPTAADAGLTCAGVVCDEPGTTCDPIDGVCKCGGQLCGAGEVCTGTLAPRCEAPACAGVTCRGNETCDPLTGTCVCPPEGCDYCAGVDCGRDVQLECDPADGQCKCAGTSCPLGTNCVLGPEPACSEDLCADVGCPRGESCDPDTGLCLCGGVLCGPDQYCSGSGICLNQYRTTGKACWEHCTATGCDRECD